MALLADGNSFRTVAALVSGKYGVSERTAQRDLTWARNRLVGELSSAEFKEPLGWFCHRTQTIVQKAEKAGAYGAAVAGMNLIYQAVLSRELDSIHSNRHLGYKHGTLVLNQPLASRSSDASQQWVITVPS